MSNNLLSEIDNRIQQCAPLPLTMPVNDNLHPVCLNCRWFAVWRMTANGRSRCLRAFRSTTASDTCHDWRPITS